MSVFSKAATLSSISYVPLSTSCSELDFVKITSLKVEYGPRVRKQVNEFLKRQLNYDEKILSEINKIIESSLKLDAKMNYIMDLKVLSTMRKFLEDHFPDLLKTRKIHGNSRLARRIADLVFFVESKLLSHGISELDANAKYLDVGAGKGEIASGFAKSLGITPERVFALELAEYEGRAQDVEWISYTQQGLIPLIDNSVDIITIMMVFHHAPDPVHLINEVYRILKKGGQVIVRETDAGAQVSLGLNSEEMVSLNQILDNMLYVTFDPNSGVPMMNNYRPRQYWLQLFEKAGFKVQVFETTEPGSPFQPVYFQLLKE
jgi:ubiquinone/menaquinone biosynthesis C-methylase UbiE